MNDPDDPVNPDALSRLIERGALFQEAAAIRLRLNPTDMRCLALAAAEPGITASRLAELSGLTTGAITGVLDRLERASLVRREADPGDRRRTLVRPLPDRIAEVDAVYQPLEAAMATLVARYEPAARAAIGDFVTHAASVFEGQTARLRAQVKGGLVGEMFSAPLGDAREGRLVFASGAPRIALRAASLGPAADARMVAQLARSSLRLTAGREPGELCRATFAGPLPDIKAGRGGGVAVRYRSRLDWRARRADVSLSPEVPWSIAIGGGLSGLSGDLRGLRVRSLDIKGGVDELELDLPAPDGTSRLHIDGTTAHITLVHPRGTAIRAVVRGGIHEVRFDAQRMRDVHGELRLETPGAAGAPDRWEIEIEDGVRSLRITPA